MKMRLTAESGVMCKACGEPIIGRAPWSWYCLLCVKVIRPIKSAAGNKVLNAILFRGFPEPRGRECVDCGDRAILYEHRDYFRPMEVDPVCDGCNKKRGPALTVLNGIQHFRVSQ